GVCAEIPGAKKPRGYWDRSPGRRRGKGGFRKGTTCSEQKGSTNLPASIRETTPSALSHRSPCVRGLRSWSRHRNCPKQRAAVRIFPVRAESHLETSADESYEDQFSKLTRL